MKKTTLLLVALGMITTLAAQEMIQYERPSRNNLEVVANALDNLSSTIQYEIADMSAPSFEMGIPQLAPQKVAKDTTLSVPALYVIPNEMYAANYNGIPYYWNPRIMLPYRDSVTYYSVFAPGTWTRDTIVVENAESFTVDAGYASELAFLSIPEDMRVNDSTIYSFYDYSYGESVRQSYLAASGQDQIHPYLFTGIYFKDYITNCAWADPDSAVMFDYGRMWAGEDGPYGYGTGLHYDATKTVDTIGTIFPLDADDIIYIDTARLRIYTIDYEASLASPGYVFDSLKHAIPVGKEIYLKLYPVTLVEQADGSFINMINKDSLIAEAVATNADIIPSPYDVIWLGEIEFVFKKKNILGVSQPSPAIINGRFYAELTGFNEAGCNFGIWCDISNFTTNGRTIFQVNGKYTTLWNNPHNIDLVLNAIFPHVKCDTTATVLQVPGEGGVAMFYDEAGNPDENYGEWIGFNSNIMDLDLMSYEGDDWLEVTFNDYYIKQNYLYALASIEAEANPTPEEREGTVTLSFAGQEFTFTVKQEAGTSAVDNIKIINDGKMYNVLGMEVGDDYKGIVIKNGKKFIR